MKKAIYTQPALSIENVEVEVGIALSYGDYGKPGQGGDYAEDDGEEY